MFGIGGFEFFLIAVIALLVIGPNELPRVLYHLGKISRKLKKFSDEIREGLEQVTEQVELEEIIKDANKAGDELTEFRIEQQKALENRDKAKKISKKKKTTKNSKSKKASKPKNKTNNSKKAKKK